jgi:nitronate monooxygenase
MAIRTRLTERLNIEHPILNAPMANSAGGRLAAAVTAAGGLGLIGGGYGDAQWLADQFAEAGNARVGCGFITWALAGHPTVLDAALAHAPAAVMLSFGDPRPFAPAVKAAGGLLICQVQDMRHAEAALDAGADIIIAQGTEAGGHGARRATLTLVPEVADLLARRSPDTLLLAAGGIADGRGLAAALMLGADGVLVGSRLWASPEAQVHPNLQRAALARDGDATLRQSAGDIVRGLAWPAEFTGRVLRNSFTDRWGGKEDELRNVAEKVRPTYLQAVAAADADNIAVHVGEAVGLMDALVPAGDSVRAIAAQAEALLRGGAMMVEPQMHTDEHR